MKPEDEIIDVESIDNDPLPTSRGYGYLAPYKEEMMKLFSEKKSFGVISQIISNKYNVKAPKGTIHGMITVELDKKTALAAKYQENIQDQYQDDPKIIDEQIKDMRAHVKELKKALKEDPTKNRSYTEAQKVLKDWIKLRADLGTPKQESKEVKEMEVMLALDKIYKRVNGIK